MGKTTYRYYLRDLSLYGVDSDGVEAYARDMAEARGGVIVEAGWKNEGDGRGDYYEVVSESN